MIKRICTRCENEYDENIINFSFNKRTNHFSCYCRACAKEVSQIWRENNRDRHRHAAKNYYKNNSEKVKEYGKVWRKENKEHTKNYKTNNKDKIAQQTLERRKNNPESVRVANRNRKAR